MLYSRAANAQIEISYKKDWDGEPTKIVSSEYWYGTNSKGNYIIR
jgi:hypothetical protein